MKSEVAMRAIGVLVADPAEVLRDYPDVLTTNEVADLWRVTPMTVRRLVSAGRLDAFRLDTGKRSALRIYKESVIRYMREHLETSDNS